MGVVPVKLSVGYSLMERGRFLDAVDQYAESIGEVYFSWPGTPSGRTDIRERDPEYIIAKIEALGADLARFGSSGIRLILLLNASCYGELALSDALAASVLESISRVLGAAGRLDAVTTASPFIASIVRAAFPSIEIRASVNMRVGTIEAMEYLAERFDGFYVQKEQNRNLDTLREMREWAALNGKKIYLLANSGCLNWCPNQVFHDNLVSHELGLHGLTRKGFEPIMCRAYLERSKDWARLLSCSNWIRPEDADRYEPLVDGLKLATRMHARPDLVIAAYARRSFSGNVLDLLEPGFSDLLYPSILRNEEFPDDWQSLVRGKEVENLLSRVMKVLA